MTLDELRVLADEFFEWPDDGDRRTVSTFSALLFAKHVLEMHEKSLEMHEMHEKSLEMHEMHEKSLGTENSAGVDALREAAQQALDYWEQVAWGDAVMVDKMDALRAALEALAGYRREVALLTGVLDKQPCDAEVALRAALEQVTFLLSVERDSTAAELRRLHAEIEEWRAKAAAWIASPEAAQRLEGYRELAQMAERAETERDALRAELREATAATNDPAVNNLRTLPESIRILRAQRDELLGTLERYVHHFGDPLKCARAAIAKATGETT